MTIIFDGIEDVSDHYKNKIRGAEFDEIIQANTNEYVIFIVDVNGEKKFVTVNFHLDFSFSFEDSFHYVNFSNFVFEYDNFECPDNIEIEAEFKLYIREKFVNQDRLSE